MKLTRDIAEKFAALALAHVQREYPYKMDHVFTGPADVIAPRAAHPIFFGSFDWHSCVHGYWLLARVLRRRPDLAQADTIRALFASSMTDANVAGECAYLVRPSARGFERPYGWGWLLALANEIESHPDPEIAAAGTRLRPLALAFAKRFHDFLPLATYPIRTGVHSSTAFALVMARDWARRFDRDLFSTMQDKAIGWYAGDDACQAWEPSLDDFLSPALIEAECMRGFVPHDWFFQWFEAFLPRLLQGRPETLFRPATVSDRTDGKIAHLDGLNFSRAWCWRGIASIYASGQPHGHPMVKVAEDAAATHIAASLPHVAGDYMGEHWLATFALLALDGA